MIAALRIDTAYVSGLLRARQTLDIVLRELERSDLPVIVEPRLNERAFGTLEGMEKGAAEERFGKQALSRWRSSFVEAPPDGESLQETASRTQPVVFENLLPAVQRGENVLVVAHGDSLKTIIMMLEELSPETVLSLKLQPGEFVFYVVSENGSIERRLSPPVSVSSD